MHAVVRAEMAANAEHDLLTSKLARADDMAWAAAILVVLTGLSLVVLPGLASIWEAFAHSEHRGVQNLTAKHAATPPGHKVQFGR